MGVPGGGWELGCCARECANRANRAKRAISAQSSPWLRAAGRTYSRVFGPPPSTELTTITYARFIVSFFYPTTKARLFRLTHSPSDPTLWMFRPGSSLPPPHTLPLSGLHQQSRRVSPPCSICSCVMKH